MKRSRVPSSSASSGSLACALAAWRPAGAQRPRTRRTGPVCRKALEPRVSRHSEDRGAHSPRGARQAPSGRGRGNRFRVPQSLGPRVSRQRRRTRLPGPVWRKALVRVPRASRHGKSQGVFACAQSPRGARRAPSGGGRGDSVPFAVNVFVRASRASRHGEPRVLVCGRRVAPSGRGRGEPVPCAVKPRSGQESVGRFPTVLRESTIVRVPRASRHGEDRGETWSLSGG